MASTFPAAAQRFHATERVTTAGQVLMQINHRLYIAALSGRPAKRMSLD